MGTQWGYRRLPLLAPLYSACSLLRYSCMRGPITRAHSSSSCLPSSAATSAVSSLHSTSLQRGARERGAVHDVRHGRAVHLCWRAHAFVLRLAPGHLQVRRLLHPTANYEHCNTLVPRPGSCLRQARILHSWEAEGGCAGRVRKKGPAGRTCGTPPTQQRMPASSTAHTWAMSHACVAPEPGTRCVRCRSPEVVHQRVDLWPAEDHGRLHLDDVVARPVRGQQDAARLHALLQPPAVGTRCAARVRAQHGRSSAAGSLRCVRGSWRRPLPSRRKETSAQHCNGARATSAAAGAS